MGQLFCSWLGSLASEAGEAPAPSAREPASESKRERAATTVSLGCLDAGYLESGTADRGVRVLRVRQVRRVRLPIL